MSKKITTKPTPKSYKVACKTDPREEIWTYNGLRFPTVEMAKAYGEDLYSRWTALRIWEVHPSEDPVDYYDGDRKRITE